jgi:undecaprenyl-diphosphatase
MLIPLLFLTDKVSSALIKDLVARPRPCHQVNGVAFIQGIHLLVGCGPGYSFPSSHAVNNFGVGTLFARYYPRWKWYFLGWAALIALSRPAVGVHYPSDILGGALIGTLLALLLVRGWSAAQKRFFPSLTFSPEDPEKP